MSDTTHCKDCDRIWSGYAECHCMNCHRHLANIGAFDAHLRERADGSLEHRDPVSKKRPYVLLDRASGPTWGQPIDQEALNRLRASGKRQSDGQTEHPFGANADIPEDALDNLPLQTSKEERRRLIRSINRGERA